MSNPLEVLSLKSRSPETESTVVSYADTAHLIIEVYSKLGLFIPAQAEQAPELLTPAVAELTEVTTTQKIDIEPFLAIDLNSNFALQALISAYDNHSDINGNRPPTTYVDDQQWSAYDLANINCRTLSNSNQPEPITPAIRGMLVAVDNEYDEPGLTHTYLPIHKQRQAIAKQQAEHHKHNSETHLHPLNITDYIVLNALRRELGSPLLDTQTYTRFPQLDKKLVGGDSYVGGAVSHDGRLWLSDSYGHACPVGGARLSVGLHKS